MVVVESLSAVDEVVAGRTQFHGSILDLRTIIGGNPTGIHRHCVHRLVVRFLEVWNAKGGIEASTEGENNRHETRKLVGMRMKNAIEKALAQENQRLSRAALLRQMSEAIRSLVAVGASSRDPDVRRSVSSQIGSSSERPGGMNRIVFHGFTTVRLRMGFVNGVIGDFDDETIKGSASERDTPLKRRSLLDFIDVTGRAVH